MPEMDVAEPALKRLTAELFLAWDHGRDEGVAGEIPPVQTDPSVPAAGCAAVRLHFPAAS
jgi:hypothetical protein